MILPVVKVSKFLGTIGLGLLTGASISLSRVSLPALLRLENDYMSRIYDQIQPSARRMQRALAFTCSTAFFVAFMLAPRRSRHPYLLYSAALCLAGASTRVVDSTINFLMDPPPPPSPSARNRRATAAAAAATQAPKMEDSELGSSVYVVPNPGASTISEAGSVEAEIADDSSFADEDVVAQVERSILAEMLRVGVWGAGFILSTVGLWGDAV